MDREKIERFIADMEQAKNLYKVTHLSDKNISPSETMCAYLIEKGYGNIEQAVREFAEKLKEELTHKCVVVHSIASPCKWDMNRDEVFELIDNLTKLLHGKGES